MSVFACGSAFAQGVRPDPAGAAPRETRMNVENTAKPGESAHPALTGEPYPIEMKWTASWPCDCTEEPCFHKNCKTHNESRQQNEKDWIQLLVATMTTTMALAAVFCCQREKYPSVRSDPFLFSFNLQCVRASLTVILGLFGRGIRVFARPS
jgi:hypothetical protein